MEKENLSTTDNELLGKFDPQNGVWVDFSDQSRRFYEKSYYGALYTEKKKPVLDSFNLVEEDSNGDFKIKDTIRSPDKKPAYILLHPLEALYLIERTKLTVTSAESQEISFDKLLEVVMGEDPQVWQ